MVTNFPRHRLYNMGPRFPGLDWDRVIEPPQDLRGNSEFPGISWWPWCQKNRWYRHELWLLLLDHPFPASWWPLSSILMWKHTQFWRWYLDLNAEGRVGYGYKFLQRPSLMVGGMTVGLWALLSKHSDWWNADNVIRMRGCNDMIILMVTMLSI
jgi:hypothetical protein